MSRKSHGMFRLLRTDCAAAAEDELAAEAGPSASTLGSAETVTQDQSPSGLLHDLFLPFSDPILR